MWPSKTFLKYVGQPEVDVEEVRHVGDVVDDLPAVGALDEHRVPPPVGPLVAGGLRDVGNAHLGLRRVALVVVPHEQQPTADVGGPGAGAGHPRCALGVGHQLAFAVAAPAPVVEGAGHLVALDGALRQVAAHVPAVPVEDLELAMRVGEHDQHGAEDLDAMRLPVQVVLDRAKAVPAARVPVGQRAGVDLANAWAVSVVTSRLPICALTRTRYSFYPLGAQYKLAQYLRYI